MTKTTTLKSYKFLVDFCGYDAKEWEIEEDEEEGENKTRNVNKGIDSIKWTGRTKWVMLRIDTDAEGTCLEQNTKKHAKHGTNEKGEDMINAS